MKKLKLLYNNYFETELLKKKGLLFLNISNVLSLIAWILIIVLNLY